MGYKMKNKKHIRFIAIPVIIMFLAQDLAFADPEAFTRASVRNDKLQVRSLFSDTVRLNAGWIEGTIHSFAVTNPDWQRKNGKEMIFHPDASKGLKLVLDLDRKTPEGICFYMLGSGQDLAESTPVYFASIDVNNNVELLP